MNCPNCNEVLVMSERQGVEIDYCPKCRGVWLDRGELDKIIDKAQSTELGRSANTFNASGHEEYYSTSNRKEHHNKDAYNQHNKDAYNQHNKDAYNHRPRKKGFLGDLFDFD